MRMRAVKVTRTIPSTGHKKVFWLGKPKWILQNESTDQASVFRSPVYCWRDILEAVDCYKVSALGETLWMGDICYAKYQIQIGRMQFADVVEYITYE